MKPKAIIVAIAATVFLVFMPGCGQGKQTGDTGGDGIIVKTDSTMPTVKPVIADSIPLKSDSQTGPLGMIGKFIGFGEHCYIMDFITKSVWKFDKSGNPVGIIRKIGNGPGEYTMLHDIDIDRNGVLYLLDVRKGAILSYDTNTLEYISEIKLPERAEAFCAIDSTTFYLHKAEGSDKKVSVDLGLYRRGSDEIIPIFKYSRNKEHMSYGMNSSNIWRSGDTVLYYKRFSPQIYQLGDTVSVYASLEEDKLPSQSQIDEYVNNGPGAWKSTTPEDKSAIKNLRFVYRYGDGIFSGVATGRTQYIYTDMASGENYRFVSDDSFIGLNLGAIGVWDGKLVTLRDPGNGDDPILILYNLAQ